MLELNRENHSDRPLILYHCGNEQCPPSHSFGPAVRPHYLIHFIRHGKGTYYVNGTTLHLNGGEGFLIYPGVTTLYAADDKDPWEYCWIGFGGTDVPAIFKCCGLSPTSLVLYDHTGLLWEDFMALIDQYSQGLGNEFSYIGQLYQCFSHMASPGAIPEKPIHETHIVKALDYIHNNYTYDIKISDIAKYLSIDRTYLYKLFMTYVQASPQQYLIHYRLDISKRLLKETDLAVTEIAYSCGFKDTPSFNKHFRRYTNTTPLKFRAEKD